MARAWEYRKRMCVHCVYVDSRGEGLIDFVVVVNSFAASISKAVVELLLYQYVVRTSGATILTIPWPG